MEFSLKEVVEFRSERCLLPGGREDRVLPNGQTVTITGPAVIVDSFRVPVAALGAGPARRVLAAPIVTPAATPALPESRASADDPIDVSFRTAVVQGRSFSRRYPVPGSGAHRAERETVRNGKFWTESPTKT